ncbi:MAG: 2-oxoglutarate dehydrogenase E1 component [Alphaproteobacteria bacterium]|nr:2-oxoglutarate dehydrogenase E1 component [Alphaproteobacteria bacterium]
MSLYESSFLTGANADFIADLYVRYLQNPGSVDASWAAFFADLKDDPASLNSERRGASWTPAAPVEKTAANGQAAGNGQIVAMPTTVPVPQQGTGAPEEVLTATRDSVRALMMVRAYRIIGHLQANLDPLGIIPKPYVADLDPAHYGFGDADMDRRIFIDGVLGLQHATLRQILDIVQRTYSGNIGVEFMHIQSQEEKYWIQERTENVNYKTRYNKDDKLFLLQRLVAAEGFERFCQTKFVGTKRFGVEGGEAMIAALEIILRRGAREGLKEAVFGMAHRGRLNVLTNILGKPFTTMFAEFQGMAAYPDSVMGSGDVKYHLGTSTDREFDGRRVHLTLNANPSHLEFVNPVVVGRVRAKQQQYSGQVDVLPEARNQVCGILIHGDAAFAGQGVVPETLMLSELKGYRTGGTIHFVINNQIGFTTTPQYSRSGVYCTDVAKMVQAPIFHVNGDDVEAVAHVSRLAIEYRQKFHHDVVVDMVCYRRHGHNESDEPAFTQPIMYSAIRRHPTTLEIYIKQLLDEGSFTQAEIDEVTGAFNKRMEDAYEKSKAVEFKKADWLEGQWSGLQQASGQDREGTTAVDLETLRETGFAIATPREKDFAANPKIVRQLEAKRQMIENGEGIDWATAEALAFGTLLLENTPVRLSGQDCGRGTFSQRHSVLYDQNNEARFQPLNNIRPGKQAIYEVHDSPLSECAVLGFDYGFSLAEPNALVCWEGQFGDFVNGAQVIIDQFICSSEAKWLRMSGIVLLLPHGYEGQGPEHSSARPERFLQMSAEDNWQVANCSTPANYFHALRRQIRRNFRKPLILMTPKSLLRHKMCVSKLEDFGPGTSFQRAIPETATDMAPDAKVRRVVLCSGKVYYDLLQAREEKQIKDVAILRLEQLYPFPTDILGKELARYAKADVVWCQEEPRNQGGWTFADRLIEDTLSGINHNTRRPLYAGRPASAAPATGALKRHTLEQAKLIEDALNG